MEKKLLISIDDFYKIISQVFGVEVSDINDDLGPNDIETWDSLGQLNMIVALEEHYKITFEVKEVFEIFTLGDVKRILAKKGIH